MLDEAKLLQSDKVKSLIDVYNTGKTQIVFEAPTGSGKTHMMAELCHRILEKEQDKIFIISSLSRGAIAVQNYEQFSYYKENGEFETLDPFLITSEAAVEGEIHIPISHNVYFLPRDLYKKDSKLMEGPMLSFLEAVRAEGKRIVVIKDECHQETKNLDSLSEYFYIVFNFSATPRKEQIPDVKITKAEAISVKLIKEVKYEKYSSFDDEESLVKALEKFNNLKTKYREKLGINPCFIIQISNKDKAEEEFELILKCLNKFPSLQYALLLKDGDLGNCTNNSVYNKMDRSLWPTELKKNLSEIDVVIFKMVISEGWNIPRACMLYQIRDAKSEQLTEQVIGRVCRNPRLSDYESLNSEQREICKYAYVWGAKVNPPKKIFPVKLKEIANITRDVQIVTTKLIGITKKHFDIDGFLNEKPKPVFHKDIFTLGREINSAPNDIKKMVYDYADSYEKWFTSCENLDSIIDANNECLHDYENNLVCSDEKVSFSLESNFEETGDYLSLPNFVWKRADDEDDDEFHFDSEAEKEWAKILYKLESKIKTSSSDSSVIDEEVKLWGKNFPYNSNICFEYYHKGIHKSYPDFVLVDKNNRIHLFECKCFNKSSDNSCSFDTDEYKEKVRQLQEAYKYASKITNQIFYIPAKKGKVWDIIRYKGGEEESLSLETFKSSLD